MTALDTSLRQGPFEPAPPHVLVGPDWLEDHLHDPLLRVVEVDVNATAYEQGHIEGAVLWNIYTDLKDSDYRLVDKAAVERLVARSGIAGRSTVVFYGYGAAIGFWLMRLYGHADLRILDCSRAPWEADGRPWNAVASEPVPTAYRLPDADQRLRVQHAQVANAIGNPDSAIVDVRSTDEFRGEWFWPSGGMEPGGRAGHVPGALHLPIDRLQDEHGAFRSVADLRAIFAPVGLTGTGEIICYCTIGGRASTAWFVLSQLLGRGNVRVYDGSWAEWGRLPEAPVQCP